jgi:hypothetical protein
MWKVGSAALLLVAAALPRLSPVAGAASAGPPPARTGGFGEMTCHECHWDNPLNEAAGALVLSGIPPTYTPGEAYTITVSVAHPEAKRAGFELSARTNGRVNSGMPAGQLRATDPLTRVVDDQGIAYISQTEEGSKAVTDHSGRWTLAWTAPSTAEPVVFHAAANAANGDASPLGDYVYSTTATSSVRRP